MKNYQQRIHSELLEGLTTEPRFEVSQYVKFFDGVIVNIVNGARAFIEAEGLDVLLNVYAASSAGVRFFHLQCSWTRLKPYVWGDAAEVLSLHAEAAGHRLLVVLPSTKNLSCFVPQWEAALSQILRSEYKLVVLGGSGKPALSLC